MCICPFLIQCTKLALCYSNADVNAQNALDKKPLHLAAAEGHAQTVETLLAAGTKVRPPRVCALTSLADCPSVVMHRSLNLVFDCRNVLVNSLCWFLLLLGPVRLFSDVFSTCFVLHSIGPSLLYSMQSFAIMLSFDCRLCCLQHAFV